MTRVFQYRAHGPRTDFAGAVDYTVTETLTETPGGLLVETHALGVCEGERVNEREARIAPGCDMATACEYRRTHGYTEVKS